jgi:hypothetical protein
MHGILTGHDRSGNPRGRGMLLGNSKRLFKRLGPSQRVQRQHAALLTGQMQEQVPLAY